MAGQEHMSLVGRTGPPGHVADPWITLAAISDATERVRGASHGHPPSRRRPAKVARKTATLDRLSGGRLVLGVGMGNDHSDNELSRTGEEPDDRRRVAGHHAEWVLQP